MKAKRVRPASVVEVRTEPRGKARRIKSALAAVAIGPQDLRHLAIETPSLGKDALLMHTLSGREELGRPFEFQLGLLSGSRTPDLDKIVGKNATVRLSTAGAGERYFNGFISRLSVEPVDGRAPRFTATLVPWLWFLTQTADCRVFQEMTAPEIIARVFRDYGFDDFTLKLGEGYPKREYTVQYRETAFDFVSRLMEDEGIYYYFVHEKKRHTMVLCDSPAKHGPYPGYGRLLFHPQTSPLEDREHVWSWKLEHAIRTRSFATTDYDFSNPGKELRARREAYPTEPIPYLETFDYPGGRVQRVSDSDVGQIERAEVHRVAAIRLEELQTLRRFATGVSDARGIALGHTFALKDDPSPFKVERYLVVRAEFEARNNEYDSDGDRAAGAAPQYRCRFMAIDSNEPFRPARVTPRRVMPGTQTAVVVGPGDQEIWVDEHARVKVHFHWDRHHDRDDERSSCWIRVSQPWAGKRFGAVNIPRIGQEVIVDFLEGDPDRPIIVGRVYNGDSMPNRSNAGRKTPNPPSMRAAAMMTSFKSNSLGGSGGHNEITMNDSADAEGLFIKAQKDEIHLVGNDRSDTVGHDETREVVNDRTRKVGNNETVEINNNLHIKVGTSITLECGLSKVTMNKAGVITITGTMITVAGMANVNIAAPITNVAGGVLLTLTGAFSLMQGVVTRIGGTTTATFAGGKVNVAGQDETVVVGNVIKLN